MLSILESRNFPVGTLYPLASGRDPGREVEFRGEQIAVGEVGNFDFSKAQLAIFSMGAGPSEEYAPMAVEAGCLVVDNSSAWRQNHQVPLVIAEINSHTLDQRPRLGIVANPNCSTMQLLMALAPIHKVAQIKQFYTATYQSVSGAGVAALEELREQTVSLLNGEPVMHEKFPDTIAFNVIPHIDSFQENGFTSEEMKIVWETHRILEDDSIKVSATAVRVPVMYGHSEAVHLTTRDVLEVQQVRDLLWQAPGVTVLDSHEPGGYPTPVSHAAGNDDVYVGRIRKDLNDPHGLHLWVVADNIRKGAALNAVQIAEILVAKQLS